MPNEAQQQMFRKHARERMELSVEQAQDWVVFYEQYGPDSLAEDWRKTLRYRQSILTSVTSHESTGE